MTLLYYDPRFLEHDTGHHPERAARLEACITRLDEKSLAGACSRPNWGPVSRRQLQLVHTPEHIDNVISMAERGGGMLDSDTVVSPSSADVAQLAAGAACDAVDRVLTGEAKTALCLIRPPGHHALARRAMGFCLFNNIAIAARVATDDHGLSRVLIVDWDVHHGNATQNTFYADGRVGFLSIHRWPFYPGTGAADEIGAGDGRGTTRNLPVAFGTSREEYLDRFLRGLEELGERIRPELVLVSAGFDSHRLDPVGSLGLEVEDFVELTQAVRRVADAHAAGRVVSLLEGGYHPQVLSECVEVHLGGLIESDQR
jgi:acetoin utilization deacetylase AcuC-like enzyme